MRAELSERASFWVTTGIVAHTLWTSAAPAMAYPLYAQQWQLTPTVTTAIFSVYPIVVVAILIAFGDLSDFIGRRTTMLCGLAASAAGVGLFVIAPNVWILFLGRILMGIGVGLSAGPSTAALVEFAGKGGVGRASATTIAGQAFGFASALLLGGLLIQYAPYPTRLSFIVLFVLILMLIAVTFYLPGHSPKPGQKKWTPRLPKVQSDIRAPFLVSTIAVMTAYTHGVMITSLGAQIARELVQSTNVFVNSCALALFAISLGIAGVLARPLGGRTAVVWGAIASIAGMAFLSGAVTEHSLLLFVLASTASGIGYALMVFGGLAIVNAATPQNVRGGVLSAVYLMAYLFTGILAVALGKTATETSMSVAVLAGAVIMTVLCLVSIALTLGVRTAPAISQALSETSRSKA